MLKNMRASAKLHHRGTTIARWTQKEATNPTLTPINKRRCASTIFMYNVTATPLHHRATRDSARKYADIYYIKKTPCVPGEAV